MFPCIISTYILHQLLYITERQTDRDTHRQTRFYQKNKYYFQATISIYGVVEPVPEGKTAPGGHELMADYWELIGSAPSGGAEVTRFLKIYGVCIILL